MFLEVFFLMISMCVVYEAVCFFAHFFAAFLAVFFAAFFGPAFFEYAVQKSRYIEYAVQKSVAHFWGVGECKVFLRTTCSVKMPKNSRDTMPTCQECHFLIEWPFYRQTLLLSRNIVTSN